LSPFGVTAIANGLEPAATVGGFFGDSPFGPPTQYWKTLSRSMSATYTLSLPVETASPA